MNQIQTDWYASLVDDLKSGWTEHVFISRWALVQGYHFMGKRIRQEEKNMPVSEIIEKAAVDLNISERKLWYAVQFVDKFPDLDKLPDGKNVSWTKIKTQYLPSRSRQDKVKVTYKHNCPRCGYDYN